MFGFFQAGRAVLSPARMRQLTKRRAGVGRTRCRLHLLGLLVRVIKLLVFASPQLSPNGGVRSAWMCPLTNLLSPGREMLYENLNTVFLFEISDKPWIPATQVRVMSTIPCVMSTCSNHNSLAIPRSLQHRIRALLLQPSVAVGMPLGSKYSCSPRATATSLQIGVSD